MTVSVVFFELEVLHVHHYYYRSGTTGMDGRPHVTVFSRPMSAGGRIADGVGRIKSIEYVADGRWCGLEKIPCMCMCISISCFCGFQAVWRVDGWAHVYQQIQKRKEGNLKGFQKAVCVEQNVFVFGSEFFGVDGFAFCVFGGPSGDVMA